ncbi:PIR Superfamily Protein [Plasmodium ovale wallikeri]|uniref:PIR Superfamily Protein n=1 Tax=Plasmodium ovale wallikeri TaxID=864142 RepID=A0A1A8YJ36_PLAOA|nr:PIR Superfamily Protein [Plasmodium ovale wallikeri]
MTDKDLEDITQNAIKNYGNLNGHYKSYNHDAICNEVEINLVKYEEINDFCMNVTGILKNFDKLSFYGSSDIRKCTIVNLWLFDYIVNKIIKDDPSKNITAVLSELFKFWKDIISHSICDIETSLQYKNYLNDIKKLYDYAINYDSLKMYTVGNSYTCSKSVKEYIELINSLYKEVKQKCDSNEYVDCKLLKDIENYYSTDYLYQVRCDKVKDSDLKGAQREKASSYPSREQGHATTHQHHSVSGDGSHSDEMHNVDTAPPFASTIMGILFPMFGIAFISFIFHKFTPLGSWLHTRVLGKLIKNDNMDKEIGIESLEDTYNYMDTNYELNEHDIGYHPVSND